MKKKGNIKLISCLLSAIIICTIIPTNVSSLTINNEKNVMLSIKQNEINYWALIVGCNEFINRPDYYLPGNDLVAENLKNLLIVSENWDSDKIRVITGKDATLRNIFNGLQWLSDNSDENDICLFYIATHGGQMKDVYPKDEKDNMDEYLLVYDTDRLYFPGLGGLVIHIPLKSFYLIDDDINNRLSKITAKGICAIFDTCNSGGFTDQVIKFKNIKSRFSFLKEKRKTPNIELIKGFSEELNSPGRVVLMACEENKQSKGSIFSYYLMEGLKGFSDVNKDDFCSAEEAFNYASPKIKNFFDRELNFENNPQILDNYTGELVLTKVELPPSQISLSGSLEGKTNMEYTFSLNSNDPENNKIKYHVEWGDNTDKWTDLYASGEIVDLKHSWDLEGAYNIWYENEDEYGMSSYRPAFKQRRVISVNNHHSLDQYQIEIYNGQMFNNGFFSDTRWMAQSFKPEKSFLTAIDLEIMLKKESSKEPQPLHVSIRKDLNGEDLTDVSVIPECQFEEPYLPELKWTHFDIPDIQLDADETYYIVCRFDNPAIGGWTYAGIDYFEDLEYNGDPYTEGNAFISINKGKTWNEFENIHDFCFLTLGS